MRLIVVTFVASLWAGCDSPGGDKGFTTVEVGRALCVEAHEALCRVYSKECGGANAVNETDCLAVPFFYNLTDCQGADIGVNWRPCIEALDAVPCPPTEAQQTEAFETCVRVGYPHGGGPNAPRTD